MCALKIRVVWRKDSDFDGIAPSGSHQIYRHRLGLMVNLQPDRNGQAKLYQVRQLLELVEEKGLSLEE